MPYHSFPGRERVEVTAVSPGPEVSSCEIVLQIGARQFKFLARRSSAGVSHELGEGVDDLLSLEFGDELEQIIQRDYAWVIVALGRLAATYLDGRTVELPDYLGYLNYDNTRRYYDHQAQVFSECNWNIHLDRALGAFAQRLVPGALVLDLGCGPGRDTVLLRERGLNVIGMDLSMGMLREARQRVGDGFACADMRRIPLPDACLVGVWLNAALLHLVRAEVPRTLRGIRRVMRAGGTLFVTVKQGDGEAWETAPYHPRFFTYFQTRELVQLLAEAGFTVTDVQTLEGNGTTWIHALATATAT